MAVTIKINPCPERYNSANPYKTGQTTSYASGDDGDLERGRGTSWTDLGYNNPFGNTNRFTDTTGAQTYANDIVIDWSSANYVGQTVLGYDRRSRGTGGAVGGGAENWSTTLGYTPITANSYNDWVIPNIKELLNIIDYEIGLNYSPFSITVNLWSSTTNPAGNVVFYSLNGFLANVPTTTNLNFIVMRTFTFTELGL